MTFLRPPPLKRVIMAFQEVHSAEPGTAALSWHGTFGRRSFTSGILDLQLLTKIFPLVLLLCNAASSVCYAVAGDFRRSLYWAASSVCIAAITF